MQADGSGEVETIAEKKLDNGQISPEEHAHIMRIHYMAQDLEGGTVRYPALNSFVYIYAWVI